MPDIRIIDPANNYTWRERVLDDMLYEIGFTPVSETFHTANYILYILEFKTNGEASAAGLLTALTHLSHPERIVILVNTHYPALKRALEALEQTQQARGKSFRIVFDVTSLRELLSTDVGLPRNVFQFVKKRRPT